MVDPYLSLLNDSNLMKFLGVLFLFFFFLGVLDLQKNIENIGE